MLFAFNEATNLSLNDFWVVNYSSEKCIFKKLIAHQERCFYLIHLIEYNDYPLKLRVARGTALHEEWDDLLIYFHKVAKSWKDNSRRRKQ